MKPGRDNTGSLLLALVCLSFAIFLAAIGVLLLLPVNTYWYATGQVVYRDQSLLAADFEGIVTVLEAGEGAWLETGAPILSYRNRERATQADLTSIRLASGRELLAKLKDLRALGYLESRLLAEKEAEIRQLEVELAEQRDAGFEAAFAGRLRYLHPPQKLLGRFVRKGEPLAVIAKDTAKSIEIAVGLQFSDRIEPGTPVKILYKSVTQYSDRKFDAIVVRRHLEITDNRMILACQPLPSRTHADGIADLDLGTLVDARILVKRASFLERLYQGKRFGAPEAALKRVPWIMGLQ